MAKTKPAKKGNPKDFLKSKNRKFCTYSNASLQAALLAIHETGISLREASKRYGIPRATMHDKFTGKSPAEKKKTGPPPLLTVEGEKKIADWAINIAKCGFPISKSDLMVAVAKIATDTGKSSSFPNGQPGIRWYKGFLKRHPEISQREAEGINKARALITEESIRSWFCALRKYIEDNNFQDVLEDPSRIFNADESGFSLCPKTGKVLGPKGWKNLYVVKSGKEKENITVLITFNASGAILPPLVVFPYVRPPKALVENVPGNWVIGKSDSGWMTGEVFFEYISNDFNSWLTQNEIKRPILLLIDGHKSHMTLPLSQFCEENDIILYALPPNTTHILQPADVSVFKPMKQEWKNTVKNWQKRPENLNQIITKINFCKVFEETLQNTQMKNYIIKGFRKCGLYPFNPDSVDYTKCVKNFLEKNCEQTPSADASKKTLSVNDFDVAKSVIKAISNDLKNYGVNVDIIINEIDFHRSLLEVDTIYPSTSTAANQSMDITVGSIVPMDNITLLPVDIMETDGGIFLEVGNNSWTNNKESALEIPTELENKGNGTQDDEVLANESKITSGKKDHIEIVGRDDGYGNKIVNLTYNKKDNRNEKVNWGENEMHNAKEHINETEEGNERECDKENEIEHERNKKTDTEIEIDTLTENEKGNKEENDKENKRPDQQESNGKIETENDNQTYTKNEQTDRNPTVILQNKISTNDDSIDEMAQTKDIIDENKETGKCSNKEVGAIISDPFQKHLTFPEAPLKKKQSCRAKDKLPSAISSAAWRSYYTRKDDERKEKLEKANMKRKNMEEKRRQKQTNSTKKSKKKMASLKDSTKIESSREDKILCTLCEEELISDAEEDENKNIGCDNCPRWYHLKCTDMSGLRYDEAAQKDYVCDICR